LTSDRQLGTHLFVKVPRLGDSEGLRVKLPWRALAEKFPGGGGETTKKNKTEKSHH